MDYGEIIMSWSWYILHWKIATQNNISLGYKHLKFAPFGVVYLVLLVIVHPIIGTWWAEKSGLSSLSTYWPECVSSLKFLGSPIWQQARTTASSLSYSWRLLSGGGGRAKMLKKPKIYGPFVAGLLLMLLATDALQIHLWAVDFC